MNTRDPLATERAAARRHFLDVNGWGRAAVQPLAADASTRSYARLVGGDRPALLMDAPPGLEAAPCPPCADPDTRRRMGYNAVARLAGPRLDAFVSIARFLRAQSVRAPDVLVADVENGFAIIEDFGDVRLDDAIERGDAAAPLYRAALEILRPLRGHGAAAARLDDWDVQPYDDVALLAEAELLTEWYAPYKGSLLAPDAVAAYREAWRAVLEGLGEPDTLVLRDYHAQNILVPADDRLAVIDFQDALIGSEAYDVVSLLEDARRDVDPGLRDELLAEERRTARDPARFAADYAILAAQRNAKILGIFARLVRRDGKDRYAMFLPRVEALFAEDLRRPGLEPVAEWVARHMPQSLTAGKAGGSR
jgi:aminoglycoside/choline kinase family phosphotransferase